MTTLLYDIGLRLYYLGILVASVFNLKARKWLDGRRNLLERITSKVAGFSGETTWIHCASLGEFEMVRPIIQQLQESTPGHRIVLTFFSPSGFEARKDFPLVDHVFYLPFDTGKNARQFIRSVRPNQVIFVKYDLWFHHLKAAKDMGAKLMLISAQFREDQSYFRFYGGMGRRSLNLFDRIFLVDKRSKGLLDRIGLFNAIICGDTRYDRAMETVEARGTDERVEAFKGNSQLIVCGSTWPADERLLAHCVQQFPDVKWIIAPHEVDERNLNRVVQQFRGAARLSDVQGAQASNIMVVDSIGILSGLYRYADVAYIGGAFGSGLHNILEASAFGVPTVFGPDHAHFRDATEMVHEGLAFSIGNPFDLIKRFQELLSKNDMALRRAIQQFMQVRTGATSTIMDYLNRDMSHP